MKKALLVLVVFLIAISSFAGGRGSGRHSSSSSYHSTTGIRGLSYSWKRAVGITAMKQRIARQTGIPTTRQGRQAKVGRMLGVR